MKMKLKRRPEVYADSEDSWLLQQQVEKFAQGKVLDIGTGTGIQAITAALKGAEVFACDLNFSACTLANENAKLNLVRARVFCSDLLNAVKPDAKFSLIIFNAPYLPLTELEKTAEKFGFDTDFIKWAGGKVLIERFLVQAKQHLAKDGKILVVFSSLTKLDKKDLRILAQQRIGFEEIYVATLK